MTNCLYIACHVYAIILIAVDLVDSSSFYYVSTPELADMTCSPPDLMFTVTTKSHIVCTSICTPITGCKSVFYNHVTSTCYGCYSYHDVHTAPANLDVESNTTYYYPDVCTKGWTRHGDSCYILREADLNWEDALADCRSLDASLVEVNADAETIFLRAFISGDDAWIGLNARAEEGTFRWVDPNTAVTYTSWRTGEPNAGDEKCVLQRGYGWHDLLCSAKLNHVCEKATLM